MSWSRSKGRVIICYINGLSVFILQYVNVLFQKKKLVSIWSKAVLKFIVLIVSELCFTVQFSVFLPERLRAHSLLH